MIVNRELRSWIDTNTNQKTQQLIVSYVTKDGNINYLTYNIPSSELYEYDYAKRNDIPVRDLLSWDRKPVKRIPTNKKLSTERVYQILEDLNANGAIDVLYEKNIPTTYFWDIENLTSPDGFIDPFVASLPITVMSWVRFPDCVIFGTKRLSPEELQKRYMTPFYIWANYDIPEATIDKMSANYLSSYVLKVAGLELSDYNKYLLKLFEKVPVVDNVGYIDKNGKHYTWAQNTQYSSLLQKYQYVQYNNMFDNVDKFEDIFYINN